MDSTNPLGLAKRCLLGDGLIVPVDDAEEAEEAEEESSSGIDSGNGFRSSFSSFSSSYCSCRASGGSGGSKGKPASFALANERWRSLILLDQSIASKLSDSYNFCSTG